MYLLTEDAAEHLRMNVHSLYALVKEKKIKAYQPNGKYGKLYFLISDLDNYVLNSGGHE